MATLTGCQAEMDTPALQDPKSPIEPTISILELKNKFDNQTIQLGEMENGEHYIIHGRVVSSDASGNIYKSLVIQDETAALAFSLNQGSLYNEYRLGQEMVVDLTGLWLGYYNGLQQVGWLDEPYNGVDQLGFMAIDYWFASSHYNGLPNPNFKYVNFGDSYPSEEGYCIMFNNFDELSQGSLTELQSQLVEFKNVHFKITEGEETYAPYQESVNRTLVDANGQELTVRNSGYSNFYNQLLPEGNGKVRGILSYYGDAWQLLLRDVSDVMITKKGEIDEPFSVSDILSGEYSGMNGWAKGYIVGSVKAGVMEVTGNDDVIFGSDAEMDNNVLIAATADVKDVTECVVVSLPQNTMLREFVNLIDNPDVYCSELTVLGQLGTDLGLPAVIDSNGGKNDFYINGETVSDGATPPAAAGSGTEADPYNVAFVMNSTEDLNEVWVTGYVAGYVVEGDFSDNTVEFSPYEVQGSNNYANNTNFLLSGVAQKFGIANTVPCLIPAKFKPTLGLKNNPGIFGKPVMIKCNITEYLGTRGIRNITEVKEL